MNIDFEKLPAVLFDWIEKFSFKQLSASQQKEVLFYFSEEEYNEVHQTFLNIKSASENNQEKNTERKSALLDHFDKHHGKIRNSTFSNVMAWQAAAILLLMLSGWLFYQVFDLKKNPYVEQIAAVDTVYVTKEIASQSEIIHDTVYRIKEVVKNRESYFYPKEQVLQAEEAELPGESETFPMLDLENLNSAQKGNSMKDDSLLRKFGFVAM